MYLLTKMKSFIIIFLLFGILIPTSFGQRAEVTSTPSAPSTSESPLKPPSHSILDYPLSRPTIVLLVLSILSCLGVVACVYITKYKQFWFTKFSRIPTHPKNVDQHNLPVVEKSSRVLEENNNNTNTSFEDNFLDDTPMITSKNSFSSTQLHPRSSADQKYHSETSLVSNQPSSSSLPPSTQTR